MTLNVEGMVSALLLICANVRKAGQVHSVPHRSAPLHARTVEFVRNQTSASAQKDLAERSVQRANAKV